jgi:hypothetical protein
MKREAASRTRATSGRRLAAATAVVVTSALLAGCTPELPAPQPEEAVTAPTLSESQEAKVISAVDTVLKKSTEKRSSKGLGARLTGPALEIRESQLKVARIREKNDLITEIPAEYQQIIPPTTQDWPRTTYSITELGDELESARLVAFEQADPREPYKMWGWVQLLPETTLPAFADKEIGSDAVAAVDQSLAARPVDTLKQYADVLTRGAKESKFAKSFELSDSDLVRRVEQDAANLRKGEDFEESDAEYRIKFAPRKGDVRAVRTADGGAVVMGVLMAEELLEAEEGARVSPLTESQAALIGDEDPTNVLRVEYTDVVALYVPAKGSKEKIRPLGFQHVATSASNE